MENNQSNVVTPLLMVKNLNMHFPAGKSILGIKSGVVKAVNNVSFSILKGKTMGLVGESGCGKTTTGKCILRILKPTSGDICYNNTNILTAPKELSDKMRREIQLIFQDPYGSLDPRQTAFAILREVVLAGNKSYTKEQIKEKVYELIKTVELLPEIASRYPHEMSGGQRQRLGIARALACEPKLIIADEPVSALDVSIQAQIINLFKDLQKKHGLTYLFIAHDLAVVRHIADTIAVMYLGNIVEMMDALQLYDNPMHPYSQALLSSIPTVDYYAEQKRSRIELQGEVPSPTNAPSGCPFHPRCSFAQDICKQSMPQLKDIGNKHYVACYLVEQNLNKI